MHIGSFNLEHVKVILRSIGTLFAKFAHNSKTAHCRAKLMNIGPRGCMQHVFRYFTCKGHLV